jgi:negative regulator of flagellin synthesis FlgM
MTININGLSTPKVQAPTDDRQLKQSAEQQPAQTESGPSSTADTISLSDNAVQLGKLDNSSVAAPVVDTKRVEQIRQAIENGSYEVNAEKVADKLMQFESILKSEK